MASGAGFMMDAINVVKRNRGRMASRKANYAKLRKQYVGKANRATQPLYKNHLTTEELKAGRIRAAAYTKARNRRINFIIVTASVFGTLAILAFLYYALKTLS